MPRPAAKWWHWCVASLKEAFPPQTLQDAMAVMGQAVLVGNGLVWNGQVSSGYFFGFIYGFFQLNHDGLINPAHFLVADRKRFNLNLEWAMAMWQLRLIDYVSQCVVSHLITQMRWMGFQCFSTRYRDRSAFSEWYWSLAYWSFFRRWAFSKFSFWTFGGLVTAFSTFGSISQMTRGGYGRLHLWTWLWATISAWKK